MQTIESRGNIIGASFTVLFVLVFVFLSLVIHIEQKPVYKTIHIQLSSNESPVKKQTELPEEKSPVVDESVSEAVSAPAEPPAPPAPAKTEAAKSAKPKKTPPAKETQKQPAKTPEPTVYKKSVEELMAEQNAPRKSVSNVDWNAVFDEEDTQSSSSGTSAQKTQFADSGFSGSAGNSSGTSGTASATSNNRQNTQQTSTNVADKLAAVSAQTYSQTSTDGIKSQVKVDAATNNGATSIKMTDGKLRELLNPKKPTISLPEEVAQLVDSRREVTIAFVVSASGKVALSNISIKPASLLPAEVQTEIKKQISDWTFSADPNGMDATASFVYTIEVR